MAEIEQLLKMIREIREHLHNLIENKKNILDPEILAVSRLLDVLLNEYEKLIREKEPK